MADITKNNVDDWRSWSSGPTASDRGTVGFNRSYSASGTTDIFISSIKFDTSASISTPSCLTYTRGTGGYLGGGQISVSDSCSVSFNSLGFSSASGGNSAPVIYVGTDSTLTAAIFAPSTGTINSLRKSGPGTLINTRVYPSTNYIGTWAIGEGTYVTAGGTNPLGTGNLELGGGATLRFNAGPIISNSAVQIFDGEFTFDLNGQSPSITNTVVSARGAASAKVISSSTSTLTLNGGISCPLTITSPAAVTLGSNQNVTGATIAGNGTINMNSGAIYANAPSYTGTITGTFAARGGTITLAANIAGTVAVDQGFVTFTNPTSSGTLSTIGFARATLSSCSFTGGSGGYTTLNSAGGNQAAMLEIVGSSSGINTGRGYSLQLNANLSLKSGANITSTQGILAQAAGANGIVYVDDTSVCTVTANISQGTAGGTMYVTARTGGTLVFNGNFNHNNGAGGKTYNINGVAVSLPWVDGSGTPPVANNYQGIVRWRGNAYGATPIILSRGTLHINSSDATNLGTTGLTVNAGTLACSSNGAYAANLTGNVTFAAGTTFKFGTPA